MRDLKDFEDFANLEILKTATTPTPQIFNTNYQLIFAQPQQLLTVFHLPLAFFNHSIKPVLCQCRSLFASSFLEMLVDTPNRTIHYTRTSYTTEVRFTGGECYFTRQHVWLLSGLLSSLSLRSFCLNSWLERVGRPVIVLPHFLVTGPACLFGSSCPLSLFFTLPIGPASHCGWSRLSSIFPLTLALTTTHSHYLGPACHCGRSRLVSPPSYLSTPHIRTTLISLTLLTSIPLPPHHIWPGLSLWQVPPTLPISNTLPLFLPPHPLPITLPYLHPPGVT